jgi:hypothetical protein
MGYEFFAGALVDLNLDAGQITIFDPATNVPSDSGALMVLQDLSNGTPVVPARLNGKFPTRVLLDSGDAVSTLISDAWKGTIPILIDPDWC